MIKNISKILAVIGLTVLTSCSLFLEKPDTTGTVDLDAVFGTTKNAEAALMSCYTNVLLHGWPGGFGIGHGTLGALSGELNRGYNWHGTYVVAQQGLSVNGVDGSDAGADNYANNWRYIRQCFIVKENIDKVADMSQDVKDVIKAEATALIAYRYMGMFYRYGGVPIVTKSFEASDDLSAGRATLEEVLQYILDLCDEAYAVLPEKWDAANTGRMTQGAVLAIKAKALMFAARPLFNSATPYLDNGELNNLICFGNADSERWKDAIDANEAVLSWAAANGVELINTGDPFDDYATATSTPGNREIILAYKCNNTEKWSWPANSLFYYQNCSPYWDNNRWDSDESGVLSNHVKLYYKNDGTEIDWPSVGDAAPRTGAEYIANINSLEPRALADIKFGGFDAKNNAGDSNWQNNGWGRGGYDADKNKGSAFPNRVGATGQGCGERSKFYYNAGSRVWFEAPLFRLAETYLNLAEAYNEYGNSAKALENLNKVHQRAGLPAVNVTDKAELRKIIQREKAIEFFQENHRYFDAKHWKHEDIGTSICGGSMRSFTFNIKNDDAATWPYAAEWVESYWEAEIYTAFWSPAMYLEPFPQTEVNKGTITQNPGY